MLAGALVAALDVDERIGSKHGAGEVLPLVAPAQDVGSVEYPAAVEALDGELADLRMHSVLHVEEVLVLPQGCQPLEQASSKSSIFTNLQEFKLSIDQNFFIQTDSADFMSWQLPCFSPVPEAGAHHR